MTDVAVQRPQASTRGLFFVFLAGLLYGSAGLFVRALPFDAWTMLAWRSLAGAAFTALALAVETGRFSWRDYAMGRAHWFLVPIGALATACYVIALNLTTVANVMVVYATVPFVAAAIAWVWNHEVPSRRTMVASSVALLGVVIMMAGGLSSAGQWVGAALTVVMNVAFALLLALARRHPEQSMHPVNTLSLLLASAIGFVLAPHRAIDPASLTLMVVFGVTTVGLAMTFFMAGARVAPSAEVALVGISDVVLGPAMVFVLFGEDPGPAALVGGAVVIVALFWNVWPNLQRLFIARRRAI